MTRLWRWRTFRDPSSGFTLIETVVTMTIAGILATMALLGVVAYAQAQQESSTANAVVSVLRDTAARAQSQGSTFCVYFATSTTWTIWQYSCDPNEATTPNAPVQVGRGQTDGVGIVSSVTMQAPSGPDFASSCPSAGLGCVFFYPQGIASQGDVVVARTGGSKTYTVNVVGLTSRVYD